MPTIVVLGVRFNLDKSEDKKIHDALYALPEGQRVKTAKEALRLYLLGSGQGTDDAKTSKAAPAQKKKNMISKALPMEKVGTETESPVQSPELDTALGEPQVPQDGKNNQIIDGLISMIQ